MKRVLLSAALLWLIVPQFALAQVYLVQERGGVPATTGAEFSEAPDYLTLVGIDSPWGLEFPALNVLTVGDKDPTEPLGCLNSIPGQSCWVGNDSTDANYPNVKINQYGWPKQLVTPGSNINDSYYVSSNFWNSEAALGDQTLYPSPKIFMPGMGHVGAVPGFPSAGKYPYPAASTQYVLPIDFPTDIAGYRYDGCNTAGQCFPVAPFVKGKLEVAVNPSGTPYVFRVNASDVVSRYADGTLVDERYYPAAYPNIQKGCHTTNCTTQNTGYPFPIQVQDLGTIPSHWSVSITGDAAVRPTATSPAGTYGGVYDVAYDIWLDIGRRPGDCVPYDPAQPTVMPGHRQCFYHTWAPATEKADVMPVANPYVMQPYGTEIMIWLGYYDGSGRAAGDYAAGALVSPAGRKITQTTIGGWTWDVWVGYGRDIQDTNLYWNMVSFIRPQQTATCLPPACYDNFATNLSFTTTTGADMDTQPFMAFVRAMDGQIYDTTGTSGRKLGCPIRYDTTNVSHAPVWSSTSPTTPAEIETDYPCAADDWWLTDIDAGFEIWDRGQGLQTDSFSVRPTFKESISSERVSQDGSGTKVFNWQKYIQLWQDGTSTCPSGSMTYDIHSDETFDWGLTNPNNWGWCDSAANGGGRWYSDMAKAGAVNANPPVSCSVASSQGTPLAMTNVYGNDWYALVSPVYSHGMHGPMTVHFYCNGALLPALDTPIYIDPSGRVMAAGPGGTATSPLYKAQVTLLRYDPATAEWPPVPDGSSIMSDRNTANSDETAYDGAFGWDVQAGTYRVQASLPGCHKVGDPSQPVVETEDLVVVDNPIVGLELLLDCNTPGGSIPPTGNLDVTLSIFTNWTAGGPNGTGGYCATVNGTNDTGAALDWTAAFTLPEEGAIYDFWNASYTQSGDSVTASGIAWNNILQPGESLRDVGFCVNRGASTTPPPPTSYTLSVSKAGSGGGTVTSSPAGINCGSACSATYASGTTVTLTATPASGSTFAGWSGACSGTGTCSVSMSASQSVTATFNVTPPSLPVTLQITSNWTTGGPSGKGGYCANVIATNNTSAAVDWNVTFTLPEPSTIYNFWNAVWNQSGTQVAAGGFDWNNILQPGQSTQSVGFCANR